jgi:acyl carrier protein
MMTAEEFSEFLFETIGLEIDAGALGIPLDELAGWDSVHLLRLASALEERTGRATVLGELLEASSLDAVRRLR